MHAVCVEPDIAARTACGHSAFCLQTNTPSKTTSTPTTITPQKNQSHGVAAADIKKLKEGGIYTVEALAHAPKKELAAIKGLSDQKVEKLQKEGARAWGGWGMCVVCCYVLRVYA
jgi:hypothetical protein